MSVPAHPIHFGPGDIGYKSLAVVRASVITLKPANGIGRRRVCFTLRLRVCARCWFEAEV
jgi:hypothetical protein